MNTLIQYKNKVDLGHHKSECKFNKTALTKGGW